MPVSGKCGDGTAKLAENAPLDSPFCVNLRIACRYYLQGAESALSALSCAKKPRGDELLDCVGHSARTTIVVGTLGRLQRRLPLRHFVAVTSAGSSGKIAPVCLPSTAFVQPVQGSCIRALSPSYHFFRSLKAPRSPSTAAPAWTALKAAEALSAIRLQCR